MQFSDTSTNQGLIQDCEFLVFGSDYGRISNDTELLQEFTRLLNSGLDKATSKILMSDTRWQYDDPNHTDYPIGKTNLVSGQKDYVLTFDGVSSHMKISRVEVVTQDGTKKLLKPFDLSDTGQAQDMLYSTDGTPLYYDKTANSLFLYPSPSYDATNGLIVHYQREPSYFEYTDTTKKAGIPRIYSRLISLYASEDFAMSKTMTEKLAHITERRIEIEKSLEDFFNKRDKDDTPKLRAARNNFK